MIGRREAIASGLAVSLLARSSATRAFGALSATGRVASDFVADERFGEAREAASAAEAGGATVRLLADDITRLYQSLDLGWRSAPFAIAGLTAGNVSFVIERLAWARGLRTVYRGIHHRLRDGRFEHELIGSPALLRRIDAPAGLDWTVLGSALAGPASGLPDRPICSPAIGDLTTLVSWRLVPKGEIDRRT